ncbi:MAG TPA: YceI family protein [Bacteriovoracaceae bacterium]|nr:YceI family protein [Bacteriovoracaceae bacterium]
MKLLLAIALALSSFLAFADGSITLSVGLTPAGSFQAVSKKPKGNLIKRGNTFTADKISVSIESFKTGIDLRDEHFWKHLNSAKHAKAVLTNIKAQDGKGTGMLEVNGVKKPVNVSYSVKGEEVVASFSVKASDFSLPKATYLGVGVNDSVQIQATIPFISK